jgi:hypothetical protein
MGFPPALVPHINCEPRRPLPTEGWDWVVCRNALWGQRPQSPPFSLLARRQERCYTAHRSPKRDPCSVSHASVPEKEPLQCFPRINPPHVIHSLTISKSKTTASFINFGELSAPLISVARRPAPRPPYGDGSRRPEGPTLSSCHRPSSSSSQFHLSFFNFALSLLREAVCSPTSKAGDPRATHSCPPFGDIIR